jgi:hypothetical protein
MEICHMTKTCITIYAVKYHLHSFRNIIIQGRGAAGYYQSHSEKDEDMSGSH